MDGAGVVHGVTEGGLAQGAGQRGEEMRGGGFVVPDVSAVTEAAAFFVVDAFEGVEFAVGGAEASGGGEGGEIGGGGFLDGGGEGAVAEGGGEGSRLIFEAGQVGGQVFGGGPGGGEAGGVMVADEVVLVAFGGVPAAPGGGAIGEAPGEEERESGGGAGCEGALEAEGAGVVARVGVAVELAGGGEIVPEEERGIPPAAFRPAAPDG